jgi:hypothetical protein
MLAPTITGTDALLPPAGLPAPPGVGAPRLRRFGTDVADLAVDLRAPLGPEIVTDVLAGCMTDERGAAVARGRIWEMAVSARIGWLLAVAAPEVLDTFSVVLRCSERSCGQPIEVDLTLAEILSVARLDAPEHVSVEADGARFLLRRPTGADQCAWLRGQYADAADAARAILRSLVVEGPAEALTEARMAALETALDEHDPLLRFTLTAICPFCDAAHEQEAPLTECALRVLRAAQARLIEDVHALARAYGWDEARIVAIPSWRRARYLTLVEREEGR